MPFRDDFTFANTFFLQREDFITLRDLKACKLSGNVFNILFNLNKFMAFESRDPFLIRQVNFTGLLSHCMATCWELNGAGFSLWDKNNLINISAVNRNVKIQL